MTSASPALSPLAPRAALPLPVAIALAAALVAAGAFVEHLSGSHFLCTCGYVLPWYGDPNGPGSSQHLTDWYTFSHIIHGFLFYGACWLWARWRGRPFDVGRALVIAMAVEVGWELLENSPLVIERYRNATASKDYAGDSILNSMSDMLSMATGFLVARLSPVWLTVAIGVGLEILCAVLIRDNLTLNVLMLLYPVPWIKAWQMGA